MAGDIAYVKTDTYTENVQIINSGGVGNYITLAAFLGHSPVIDAVGGAYGLYCAAISYIEMDGFEVLNSNQYGVNIWQSDRIRMLNLTVHDNQESGIVIAGSGATHPYLEDCICYDNGLSGSGHGILAYNIDGVNNAGDDGELYNCVCYNNGANPGDWASGIEWQGADSVIQGCTCYGNMLAGFDIAGDGAHDNTIAWCVAYQNEYMGFTVNSGGHTNTFHHCIAHGNCQANDWGAGFWIINDADNCEFYNCTAYDNGAGAETGGFAFIWNAGTDPANCVLVNCLTWGNLLYSVFIYDAATLATSDYNDWGEVDGGVGDIWYNGAAYGTMAAYRAASGLDANSISADPIFVDLIDFELTCGVSPCIDAGINVGYWFAGAAPDMGAQEAICGASVPDAVRIGAYTGIELYHVVAEAETPAACGFCCDGATALLWDCKADDPTNFATDVNSAVLYLDGASQVTTKFCEFEGEGTGDDVYVGFLATWYYSLCQIDLGNVTNVGVMTELPDTVSAGLGIHDHSGVGQGGDDLNPETISQQTFLVGPGCPYTTVGAAVAAVNAAGPPSAANPYVILVMGIVTAEAGNVTIPSYCVIVGHGDAATIGMGANQLIFSSNSGALDIKVTGNPAVTLGVVYANNATGVDLRNVHSVQSTIAGYAFRFSGTSTVKCHDCFSETTGTDGIGFYTDCTLATLRDCVAEASAITSHGFYVAGTGTAILTGCRADDTTNFATGLAVGNTACTVATEHCVFHAAALDVSVGAAATWYERACEFEPANCSILGTAVAENADAGDNYALPYLNTSGATRAVGAVGYIDTAGEFKTTTTAYFQAPWAVVVMGGLNNADIYAAVRGRVTVVLNGNCNVGDFLYLSTTAGQAQPLSYPRPEMFARALTANAAGAGGTCEALLYCHTKFIPQTAPVRLIYTDYIDDTDFNGTIAGLASPSFTYNIASGDEDVIDPEANNYLGKIVIHNTTRGDSALIDDANVGINQITLTAAIPGGWLVGDAITSRSTTCILGGPEYMVELDLTDADNTVIPITARALFIDVLFTDTSGASAGQVRLHPFEAYAGSKDFNRRNFVVGFGGIAVAPMPLIQQRFVYACRIGGVNTGRFALALLGWEEAVP